MARAAGVFGTMVGGCAVCSSALRACWRCSSCPPPEGCRLSFCCAPPATVAGAASCIISNDDDDDDDEDAGGNVIDLVDAHDDAEASEIPCCRARGAASPPQGDWLTASICDPRRPVDMLLLLLFTSARGGRRVLSQAFERFSGGDD